MKKIILLIGLLALVHANVRAQVQTNSVYTTNVPGYGGYAIKSGGSKYGVLYNTLASDNGAAVNEWCLGYSSGKDAAGATCMMKWDANSITFPSYSPTLSNYVLKAGDVMSGPLQTTSLTASSGTFNGAITTGISAVKVANAKSPTGYWHSKIQDTTSFGAGVGGGLQFTGYKQTGGEELFAGIDAYKEDAGSGNANAALRFHTQPQDGSGLVERMRISGTGAVSIPGSAFSVGGSTLVVANGLVGIGATSLGSKLYVKTDSPLDTNNALSLVNTANVANQGIGTGMIFYSDTLNHDNIYNTGRIYSDFDGNTYGSAKLVLQSPTAENTWTDTLAIKGGNVGFGETAPQSKVDIASGTIHMAGTASPTVGYALCLTATGFMGHCSAVNAVDGTCTCVTP